MRKHIVLLVSLTFLGCGSGGIEAGGGSDAPIGASADAPSSTHIDARLLCGDGILESGEECDDGNLKDGDGCSATCGDGDENADCGCVVAPRRGGPGAGSFALCCAAAAVLLVARRRRRTCRHG